MKTLQHLQSGGTAWTTAGEIGKRMIPVYGTYLDWKDFAKNPTFRNGALAAASTVGDALTIFGVGSGIKAGVAAAKAADKVSDAMKIYEAAHKTATNARSAYQTANSAFNKATNRATATSLAGGNQTQVIAAQKKVNTARQAVQEAANNYKTAQQALDGTIPTLKTTTQTTPGGATFTTKTLQTSYPSTYKYGQDAKTALERAQGSLQSTREALPTTTEKIALPLGNIAIHGAITGISGTEPKQQGGTINYLNLFK